MGSLEIRINSQLITHIYIKNSKPLEPNEYDKHFDKRTADVYEYKVAVYMVETGTVIEFLIQHNRRESIEKLTSIILVKLMSMPEYTAAIKKRGI